MPVIVQIGSSSAGLSEYADIANVVVAAFALITAAVSVFFTWKGLKNQERHNALSVIPVPFIALADYENLIRVKIRNDGIGPLIINKIDYEYNGRLNEHNELVEYLPHPPENMTWSNFSSGYYRSIPPGDVLILIEIDINDQSKISVNSFRNQLRLVLSQMKITVHYTDVYGNMFEDVSRELSFFARRLSSSAAKKKIL